MYHADELFLRATGKRALANITYIDNVPSIMRRGILCYDSAQKLHHRDVALDEVQSRRHRKRVPNGLLLHQYACLYFSPRNPMMYYRKCHTEVCKLEELCVLAVSPQVLTIDGVVIADGNATSEITRFYDAEEGLQSLDFETVYAQWWNSDNIYEKEEKKRVKCAEVLVPRAIPYGYITEAIVPTASARDALRAKGFNKPIMIHPDTFFYEGGE